METSEANAEGRSVDPDEVERFARLAADWWNPRGSMKALHRLNPVRLRYIRERIAERFGSDPQALDGLRGLKLADIGCGAGLLSEPLARLGAEVLGIDAAATGIEVAKLHAARTGVTLAYRCTTAEDLVAAQERFDVVLAMEIIEHVVDPDAFLASCAELVNPGGLLILSTLNRTMKAYAMAIVGAEYILGWLPRGTHQWEKFVRPSEIEAAAMGRGFEVLDRQGVSYDPFHDEWRLSSDLDVNYMMALGPQERPLGAR
jgi:2-polyprenyl-6-hydroxyphenyl methylase/3-demethylubiquinone-9 3-methyltransferase